MSRALPSLALAALVLAAGSATGPAFASSPVLGKSGGIAALNPQPIPPGRLESNLFRNPPVCLSCPPPGLRLPGSDRSLNPQPLPPRLFVR